MQIFKSILLCIAFLTTISCSETNSGKGGSAKNATPKFDVPAGWKTLTADLYEINYPADWHSDNSGQMGTIFILFSPDDNENDDFKENFTLMMEDLPGSSINLEAYAISSVKQIKQIITDAHITTSETISTNGRDAFKLIYTGKQGELDLHFLQYFFVKNKKAFVLSFTAKQDSYANYEKLAEQMMKTFILKD